MCVGSVTRRVRSERMDAKAAMAGWVALGVLWLPGCSSSERAAEPAPRSEPGARSVAGEAPRPPRAPRLDPASCDRFAAPTGSPDGDGSRERPVRGPAGLVRLLGAGETGCLRAGTYTEVETVVRRPRVTLRSAPGERATWRGRVVLRGRGDRLLELDLDGSAGPRCKAPRCGTLPSPTIAAPDVLVAYDDITSPGGGICVATAPRARPRPDRFRVVANRVHDCGRLPPTEHDHGVYVPQGYGGEIRANVVYANADRGIQLYPDAHYTTVANNTVDGNGSGLVFSKRAGGNVVRDNVFTNSVVRWNAETFKLSGTGNSFVGNCVHAGNADSDYNEDGGVALPSAVAQSGTRVARDAVYRDRRRGDFRVLPSSACAGRGAPARIAAGRLAP